MVYCGAGTVHKKRLKGVLESAVGLRSEVRVNKRKMKVVEMEVSPGEHDAGEKEEFKGRRGKQSELGEGGGAAA